MAVPHRTILSSFTSGTTPWHLSLVLLEIALAPLCPAQSHFHGILEALWLSRILRTFIECHDDVGAQSDLRFSCRFRRQKMRRAIQMRAKRHSFFRHFP